MRDATRITTVVTAASSYDLTDLGTFKNELGITNKTDDAYIARLVTSASLGASQYCNRVFAAETVLDEFWAQRDPFPNLVRGGFSPLQLSRWPVISVAAVTEDGNTLVEGTDFLLAANLGQLVRLDDFGNPRRWPNLALTAQYQAGFDPIPADLVDAVLRMMRLRWFARKRDPMLRSENIPGVREAQWWIATGTEAGNVTPDIADLLDAYRVPVATSP